jgi:Na+/H+ antiporter NhaC
MFHTRIGDMNKSNRTRKAQEVHAEQLLKVSTSLFTAFFVVILIVPISAIVGAAFKGIHVDPKDVFLSLFSSWYTLVFIAAELGLYCIVLKTKTDALAIYDELYPDEVIET